MESCRVSAGVEVGIALPHATPSTDCEALVDAAVVVDLADEGPFETFDRLGLVMVSENPDPK